MIVCNVKCSICNCNIHVATCLPRLDETCRTHEEVGMFGRIMLLHRVVQLYAVALVCSCMYPVWASVLVG